MHSLYRPIQWTTSPEAVLLAATIYQPMSVCKGRRGHTLQQCDGQQHGAGLDGRVPKDQLVEGRDIVHLHQEIPSIDKHGQTRAVDDPRAEDMHRDQWKRGPFPLPQHERHADGHAHDEGSNHMRRVPGVLASTPVQAQQQYSRPAECQRRADKIHRRQLHLPRARDLAQGHEEEHAQRREHGEWEIEPEDPPPRLLLDRCGCERASDHGPDAVRDRDHCAENTLIFTSFAQRDHVADDHLGDGHKAAAADASEGAEDDELGGCLGEGGGQRAEEEDGEAGEEDVFAGPDVGEAAVEQLEAGGCTGLSAARRT